MNNIIPLLHNYIILSTLGFILFYKSGSFLVIQNLVNTAYNVTRAYKGSHRTEIPTLSAEILSKNRHNFCIERCFYCRLQKIRSCHEIVLKTHSRV